MAIRGLLLIFLTAIASAEEIPALQPSQVSLAAGVTGAQIQEALDALPPEGGEVDLPAGKIEIDQPIVLCRDNQILRGMGASTVLHLADNANCPVIIMGEPVNKPSRTVQHLLVAGLFIDGNRIHQQRELWRLSGEGCEIRNNGITVQGVTDSLVTDVVTARCRSGGLVTTRDIRRLTVQGLESFDNEFDGLACYQTEDCVFANVHSHDNPGAGISLDLAFNHNVISNAVLVANDLGIFMRASRENQFLDVSIRDSRHHGVFMANSEMATAHGWGPVPQTECVYNAFTNLMAMNCGGAAFRVNNTTCTNNIIIRPKFAGNTKGGLSLARPNLVTVR
jgi:nitrous oxidase accessory protein NosD